MNRFIYLDTPGLSLLRAQASIETVAERTRSSNRATSSTAQRSLGAALHGISGSIGGTTGHNISYGESTKLVVEGAVALEAIMGRLAAQEDLFSAKSIRDVADLIASNQSAFVYGSLPFRLEQTIDGDPVGDAVAKQMLEFKVPTEASDDGGYLNRPIRMGGSFAKFVDRKDIHDGNFVPTGHLAAFVRGLKLDPLRLGFFAHLDAYQSQVYLKPFAIWRV